MEHRTLDELRSSALTAPARAMTRREKLERWATLLERHTAPLKALAGIEFLTTDKRLALRGDNSPLALAYADPVLREQGLCSDQLGAGMAFFGLSSTEAHRLLCVCHCGRTVQGDQLAVRLRYAARHPVLFRFFNWL